MRSLVVLQGRRQLTHTRRNAIIRSTATRPLSCVSTLISNKQKINATAVLSTSTVNTGTCSYNNNATTTTSSGKRHRALLLYSRSCFSTLAQQADDEEDEFDELELPSFSDLSELDDSLKHRLQHGMGLNQMTEIQAKTWKPLMEDKDVLARARTGTGKTLAFLLPTLQRLLLEENNRPDKNKVGMLILSPTRELAMQIAQQVRALTTTGLYKQKNHKQHDLMTCQVLVGGSPKHKDITQLQRSGVPDILIATPGRLQDHLQTTVLTLNNKKKKKSPFPKILTNVKTLVLDEMDRLLDMGFRRDVEAITSYLPRNKQTLLFSATLPQNVQSVILATLKPNYETVDCIQQDDSATHTNAHVQQSHVMVPSSSSMMPQHYRTMTSFVQVLYELVESNPNHHKIICFFPTTNMVKFYSNLFNFGLGRPVLELHSKKTQAYRTSASNRFREANSSILFTSDVSARGVDYPNVTHVVQYGMAETRQAYIHRLGRTGRGANQTSGEGILMLHPIEEGFLTKQLGDLNVTRNDDLQTLLNESSSSKNQVMDELEPILASIRRGTNQELMRDAQNAYRSLLGFYSGRLHTVGIRSKEDLIDLVNGFAMEVGLTELPSISYKTAKNMGVHGLRGLNIQAQGDVRQGRNGRSSKKRNNSWRKQSRRHQSRWKDSGGGSLTGRGSYADWGGRSSRS